MKVRRKPVIYEAEQWFPGIAVDGVEECTVEHWIEQGLMTQEKVILKGSPCTRGRVKTLEGEMWASPGDFILTGIRGEKWPVKPDVFEASYEILP